MLFRRGSQTQTQLYCCRGRNCDAIVLTVADSVKSPCRQWRSVYWFEQNVKCVPLFCFISLTNEKDGVRDVTVMFWFLVRVYFQETDIVIVRFLVVVMLLCFPHKQGRQEFNHTELTALQRSRSSGRRKSSTVAAGFTQDCDIHRSQTRLTLLLLLLCSFCCLWKFLNKLIN